MLEVLQCTLLQLLMQLIYNRSGCPSLQGLQNGFFTNFTGKILQKEVGLAWFGLEILTNIL